MPPAEFTTLETARLRLRYLKDDDLEAFLAYRNDPQVARYQSWESANEADAREFIQEQKTMPLGVPGEWFQIAIEEKESGALVGDCAIHVNKDDERQAEIGYTLARRYQGQGFAREAISCLLTYAFLALDLHRIVASTDCENTASIALLERLGLRREGHFIQSTWFKGQWADEYLYAILKEEWLLRHSTPAQ